MQVDRDAVAGHWALRAALTYAAAIIVAALVLAVLLGMVLYVLAVVFGVLAFRN